MVSRINCFKIRAVWVTSRGLAFLNRKEKKKSNILLLLQFRALLRGIANNPYQETSQDL